MLDISQLRVCFLAGTLSQGGAERQLYYMLRLLRQRGAEVRLLTFGRGEFWEEPIKSLGVPVIGIDESHSRLERLRCILRDLREWRPNFVQSQHFYTNAYVAAAARLTSAKDIGAMRNDGTSEVQDCGRGLGWLNLYLPRLLAGNSQPALTYAEARGIPRQRLFFLPNVVDTDLIRPTPRSDSLPVQILLVGRLERQKRIDRFLNLIARINKISKRPIKGVIVGSGSLQAELIAQAETLGLLPDIVDFRGTKADMAAVYREAHIFALTSDHEGTPNVVLEAMAAGLPVVATRVGGVSAIVHHGATGFLAEAGDEECLAQPLLKLIDNPALREAVGTAARASVEHHHSPATLLEHLIRLYHFRSKNN